ncbi:MAG: hypothetical protein Q7V88_11020 [Actinomycetota bacterium]|nr:hypothetical protein [Actinomycetota bacterium]
MSELEARLAAHLGERAQELELVDQGVEHVKHEGRRIRSGRTLLLGAAASVAVIGVAVAAVVVFGGRNGERTTSAPPAEIPLTLGLPDATAGAATFEWSVEDSPDPGSGFGAAAWWAGASSNGLSNYTFGTVPRENDSAQQQLFSMPDGVQHEASGAPFDPWITDLDSTARTQVYAIGTVPAGQTYGFQTGLTADGGTNWQYGELPLDLDTVRTELNGLSTTGAQIVAGDGGAVAVVQTIGFTTALQIDGVDTQYGTRVTTQGVEVFSAPDDLAAAAALVCPPGWPLVPGPPREFAQDGGGGMTASTVPFAPGRDFPGGGNEWHCESPNASNPDLWLDASQVHGPVSQVVPFAQLGLSDASLKALRNSVRIFHSPDGLSWTEIDTDAGGGTTSPPVLLWTGSQFALRVSGAPGAQLWLSPDGTAWAQATLPTGSEAMAFGALPDGSLLLAGRAGGELASYVSPDGSAWSGVSLDALVGLDKSWRISNVQMVGSPDAVSLMVSAAEDLFASLGPPVIDHGRYRLRLSDTQGSAELLGANGQVLDRIDNMWQSPLQQGMPASLNGMLAIGPNGGGVVVLDPATGETIDVFGQSEISLASDAVYASERGQQFNNKMQPSAVWMLDTVDGSTWGITPVTGLGGANTWISSAASATPGGHSYRISVNNSAAVILGRPT